MMTHAGQAMRGFPESSAAVIDEHGNGYKGDKGDSQSEEKIGHFLCPQPPKSSK